MAAAARSATTNLRTLVDAVWPPKRPTRDDDAIEAVVAACEGDARAALTTVEVAVALARAAARRSRPPR